ncbi:glycosyltransferase family 4 protein [Vibrio algivorus]|uniref:Glycosyl transferase n=1 Tax=Vibrio algivorus TaxID=1667024 RepID=A0ABQ6EKA1_9VIBR|nr:glycosyltransferase family 4 protein [Vibrio algivorus]GLT13181.1 glycosyl transferase [Vibrio algivorus]
MKRIAISANSSWYLYNFRRNTIYRLIKEGYDVIALAPKDEYSDKLEEIGAKFLSIDIDAGGTNPFRDLKTLISFFRVYRVIRVSCVLNFTPKNNIYSTIAASMLNVPTINNIAGLGLLFVKETISSKIAKYLYKVSQRKATKIFFQNEDDRELFRCNNIASMNNTERLPGSGVDLARFKVSLAPDDGIVRFLLLARMLYDKGVKHYVDAARTLKNEHGENIEFYLLGFLNVNNPNAISKEQMKLWDEEGIVKYLGTSDKVEEEIAKIDCIVLPSFYREGVPKSLLEAAAMGKPIITTNSVGCKETVDHEVNGYLCEPQDTVSLTKCMDKMAKLSYSKRVEFGLNSRRKVEQEFDEDIVIQKYVNAITNIINGK